MEGIKEMKKILTVVLALTLALCMFTGCSAPAQPAGNEGAEDTNSSEFTTVEPGKLKVALSPDFAPMEFCDVSKTGQDQYVGFDVMLANFIAQELGLELEICPMNFDACQTAVQLGSVDISISGYSKTDARAANYNLSDYYYAGDNETEQVVIVTADNAGKYSSAADFSGLKVGAQAASLQLDLVTAQLADAEAVIYTDITTGVLQLEKGDFDGMAVAKGNADALIANNKNLAMSGFEFEVASDQENNVVLLKKGADVLTAKINEILAKAYEAGYYGEWYAAAEKLAGLDTAQEVSIEG